jgi:hypothetical protein
MYEYLNGESAMSIPKLRGNGRDLMRQENRSSAKQIFFFLSCNSFFRPRGY